MKLAIDGGEPIRKTPFPPRQQISEKERAYALEVLDEAMERGVSFRYQEEWEERACQQFCRYMGGGYADLVNSGTNALFVVLGALRIPPLSEVIAPPITDEGGVMPICYQGLIPIPSDTQKDSFNASLAQIQKQLSPRTRAVLVTHMTGEVIDLDPIVDFCEQNNLILIEDCSQAFGAEYKGQKIGTYGDISIFSFGQSKHLSSGGQGGLIYTQSEDLYWKVRSASDRGKDFGHEADAPIQAGLNCNLNELSSAIALAQIERLPGIVSNCRRVGQSIEKMVSEQCQFIQIVQHPSFSNPTYWFVRLKVDFNSLGVTKEKYIEALQKEGIPAGHFGRIPFKQKWYAERKIFGEDGFPWTKTDYQGSPFPTLEFDNAEKALRDHIAIFMRESYQEEDIRDITKALSKLEQVFKSQ